MMRSRIGRAFFLTLLCAASHYGAIAQMMVVADVDGKQLPVVDMEGSMAVIEENGGRTVLAEGNFSMVPAAAFTDGAIRIESKDAYMGENYGGPQAGFFFRFKASLRAERDFEDCFVLFLILPEEGQESIIMREIPDVLADGVSTVDLAFPVNPGFGGGQYRYFFMSKGEQIEVTDPNAQAAIRTSDPRDARPMPPEPVQRPSRESPTAVSGVELKRTVYPNYPAELEGSGVSGVAKVIFTVNTEGEVVEIIEMVADHPAFLGEMRRAVLESEYNPGYFDGEAMQSAVYQEFTFNELVVFPGSLQVIAYPDVDDREPALLYVPEEEPVKGTAAVEVLIDVFGQASELEITGSSSDEFSDFLKNQIGQWVFQPAIEDGFPTERRIRIPITIPLR